MQLGQLLCDVSWGHQVFRLLTQVTQLGVIRRYLDPQLPWFLLCHLLDGCPAVRFPSPQLPNCLEKRRRYLKILCARPPWGRMESSVGCFNMHLAAPNGLALSSSICSSPGTANSTRSTCLVVSDTRTMSGPSVVTVMVSENLSCLPRSTFNCRSCGLKDNKRKQLCVTVTEKQNKSKGMKADISIQDFVFFRFFR